MDQSLTTNSLSEETLALHLGRQVRARRLALGMTQDVLGKSLGLTFQQIQKYEQGSCRISACRLFDLSRVLRMPITYFYEPFLSTRQMSPTVIESDSYKVGEEETPDLGSLYKGEDYEFMRLYQSIKSPHMRQNILELLKAHLEAEATAHAPCKH